MERQFHFVVFGATGFTGKFVAKTLAKHAGNRRWAVAGRNDAKLRKLLEEISDETGIDCSKIDRLACDVGNPDSVSSMTEKTRVVLNCVGPYRFYGETVVKACVEKSTDYVDISGEPFFMESIALKYDEAAKEKGCFVVSACGFDSVPCDIGIQYAERTFHGVLDAVEVYHEFVNPRGTTIHTGTFESLVHGVANFSDLKTLRRLAMSNRSNLPKSNFKLAHKGAVFYNEDLKAWCVPFLGSDRSVAQRSNILLYDLNKKRPIQVQTYVKMPGFFHSILLLIWAILFFVMTRFNLGKRLLLQYPEIFSFGFFSRKGPSEEQIEASTFKTHIFGQGWAGDSVKPEDIQSKKPSDRIHCVVEGPECGYVSTSATMVACAMTTLEDRKMLPGRGGVFTTAAAYSTTNLIDRLKKLGLSFREVQ